MISAIRMMRRVPRTVASTMMMFRVVWLLAATAAAAAELVDEAVGPEVVDAAIWAGLVESEVADDVGEKVDVAVVLGERIELNSDMPRSSRDSNVLFEEVGELAVGAEVVLLALSFCAMHIVDRQTVMMPIRSIVIRFYLDLVFAF
jgi:hypothetical protein